MKKMLVYALLVTFILGGGCGQKTDTVPQETAHKHVFQGYFNEDLATKAMVKIDTSALGKMLAELLPAEKIFSLYGSGYHLFYLRLVISPDNISTFELLPDASTFDGEHGVGRDPLSYQDIHYDFPKERAFYFSNKDTWHIFDATAGKFKDAPVKCIKLYELYCRINKDRKLSLPWNIHEVSVKKYLAQLQDTSMTDWQYDQSVEIVNQDAFNAVRKNIHYPELALKNGITGRVFVEIFAEGNGKYAGYKLLKGLGFGCDEEVTNALQAAKITAYPSGARAATIIPFSFGPPQSSPVDLAVEQFNFNPDTSVYNNVTLSIVNRNAVKEKVPTSYWVYAYIDGKLAYKSLMIGGVTTARKQLQVWFHWVPGRAGAHDYAIYIDPENKLNDANRENNVVTGNILVH